jgi:formamidopyrimidine-DNA glycosylase
VPELPDLQYMEKILRSTVAKRRIEEAFVKEPVVIRMMRAGSFAEALRGRTRPIPW